MSRILALTASVAALTLVAAGCGDDNGGEEGSEQPEVTARQALAEIPAVREGLRQGLGAYRAGDAERADTLIGNAYLEHFELVEVPLEEVDPELNEELEELIATEIRDEIEAGAPVPEVAALVAEAQMGLTEAETALEAG